MCLVHEKLNWYLLFYSNHQLVTIQNTKKIKYKEIFIKRSKSLHHFHKKEKRG